MYDPFTSYDMDVSYGPLPNPLLRADGSRVTDAAGWRARRREILQNEFVTEFGGMPPQPEVTVFTLVTEKSGDTVRTYRIECGTREKTFTFGVEIFLPAGFDEWQTYPVLICGDGCWRDRYFTPAQIQAVLDEGFLCVLFDRTEVAADDLGAPRSMGIYTVYPDAPFKTISAWAYGYHRVVDLLMTLPYAEKEFIGITGHSRGGKTTLVAGATDERIRFINCNGSGTHGCGCYHYETRVPEGQYTYNTTETIGFMKGQFPYWMGDGILAYAGREAEIPYDMHYFKALLAPRYFVETEGIEDIWANPHGSYQTFLAAKAVYKLLGAEDHAFIHYREGGHFHRPSDIALLTGLMRAVREGRPADPELTKTYFPGLKTIFDF